MTETFQQRIAQNIANIEMVAAHHGTVAKVVVVAIEDAKALLRDTQRLDAIEALRGSVGAIMEDVFVWNTVPALVHWYVEVDYYKTRAGGGFNDVAVNGPTLRDAIDAMCAESVPSTP